MSVKVNYYYYISKDDHGSFDSLEVDLDGPISFVRHDILKRLDLPITRGLLMFAPNDLQSEPEVNRHERVKTSVKNLAPVDLGARVRARLGATIPKKDLIHLVLDSRESKSVPAKRRRSSVDEIKLIDEEIMSTNVYLRMPSLLYDFLWKKEENFAKLVRTSTVEVPLEVPVGPKETGDDDMRELTVPVLAEYIDLTLIPKWPEPGEQDMFISRFLLREEYREFDDFLEDGPKRTLLVGQPGIGKTVYILYALLNRLKKGKPTYLSMGPKRAFLFQDSGVYSASYDAFTGSYFVDETERDRLVLLDLNSGQFAPQPFLRGWNCVVATSPERKRYSKWFSDSIQSKGRFIMKTWSWTEVYLSRDMTKVRRSVDGWRVAFTKYGGSARKLLATAEGELENEIAIAIKNCIDVDLVLAPTENDFKDGVSHALVQINPLVVDDKIDRSKVTGRIISNYICELLLDKKKNELADRMTPAFHGLVQASATRSAAGIVFEAAGHRYIFRNRNVVTRLRSLEGESGGSTMFSLPQLQTINTFIATALPTLDPTCYYRPLAVNLPGIDSFAMDGDATTVSGVIMFQFIVGDEHAINPAFLDALWTESYDRRRTLPAGYTWKLVFVVPERLEPFFQKQSWKPADVEKKWGKRVDQYVLGVNEKSVWEAMRKGYYD